MTQASARAGGAPARFDASAQHRRAMLAKVHIAKVQLRLTDDDYRAVLLREVGRTSAADCSQDELGRVLRAFERQGFDAKARPRGRSAPADHPAARKSRAMWISLGLLGAIDDPSEKALERFAKRQLHCDRLQWANQQLAYKLVEALKAIAERHGWEQSLAGVSPQGAAHALKRRLVDALLVKLRDAGLAPAEWTAERAAFEFGGIETQLLFASADTLDLVAQTFGRVLAGAKR